MPDDRLGALLWSLRQHGRDVEQTRRAADAALDDRDVAVRAARDAGASLAQIADALGLTRSGAQAVVRRSLR